MAGLKTIIALSFVRSPFSSYFLRPSMNRSLTPGLGPCHRFPPRHPLLRAMAQLPSSARRRDLCHCAIAQLDMRALRESR